MCLPSHTTHLLQPLDVGFFQPLSTAYRKHLDEHTELGKGYSIDKTDFLRLIQLARKNAATEKNIKHAWQKSGLFPEDSETPIDPQVVFDRLSFKLPGPESRPTTPPAMVSDDTVPVTPTTAEQVNRMIQQIKAGDHNGPILLDKIGKACNTALASNTLLRATNDSLLKAQQIKADRDKRKQAHYGDALLMNNAIVQERNDKQAAKQQERENKQQERQDKQADRQFEQQFRSMCRLGPDIFAERRGGSPAKKKISPTQPAPGPLTSLTLDPPGPSGLRKQQQSQRGGKQQQGRKGWEGWEGW